MHNTSSQLYKYVSNLIIEFFVSQKIQAGDRYNLYLEDIEHIDSLYNSLKKNSLVPIESFSYTHPDGGQAYSTFSLLIEGTKVIIASSTFASEDYFTMLRNKVADQNNEFEGTSILILFSGKLDSLLGGSGSLIKEGMPLHYTRFKSKIENDIEQTTVLKKHEKVILKAVLDKKTKSAVEDNNSIFDYEQVINSLQKGTIEKKDYQFLGLFPQEELSSKTGDLAKDLSSNFTLYDKFENIFLNGNPATDLEQDLPTTALARLIKEDWHEFDYSEIEKWMEKEKRKTPPNFESIEGDNLLQTLWYRTDGESVSKKRNVNLIIFNPSLELPFKLNVKYDQFIKKEGINIKQGSKNISASNSGHNLIIEFKEFDADNLFSLIEYRDSETDKKYIIKILHLPFKQNIISQFEGNFQLNVQKSSSYLQIKESPTLIFNPDGEIHINDILSLDTTFKVNEEQKLIINYDYALVQEDLIHFKVDIDDILLPIAIKTDFELPKPITGIDVWKEKRVNQLDFKYIKEGTTIKLLFKNNEKTVRDEFRNNLIQEEQIIYSEGYSWFLGNENGISNNEIELDTDIKDAFDNLRNYFRDKQTQPSLVYLNEELKQIALTLIKCFITKLEQFEENKPLTHQQKNLLWLGVVKERIGEEKIKLTLYQKLCKY